LPVYVGDAADVAAWMDRDAAEVARLKAQLAQLERKNYDLVATVVRLTECVCAHTRSAKAGGAHAHGVCEYRANRALGHLSGRSADPRRPLRDRNDGSSHPSKERRKAPA
jgi:hypothetical protein